MFIEKQRRTSTFPLKKEQKKKMKNLQNPTDNTGYMPLKRHKPYSNRCVQ